jgi:hypothetical protein
MSTGTFQRLRWHEWLWLILLVAAGRLWVAYDQELLPQRLLMPAFLALVLLLLVGFFALLRPARPFALARTVALALGAAVATLIVVQHVLLTFDLSYKAAIVLAATVAFPFLVAAGYKWVDR